MNIDKFDRAILDQLQRSGRISNVDLADLVGLSESACLRRVKSLQESGIIKHYSANVDGAKVGLPESVFVRVSLNHQQKEQLARFEEAVQAVPEVMECYLMSGDVDFMMRVVAQNTTDYERIHNTLTRLPGVSRLHTSFALRKVLKRSHLPLPT